MLVAPKFAVISTDVALASLPPDGEPSEAHLEEMRGMRWSTLPLGRQASQAVAPMSGITAGQRLAPSPPASSPASRLRASFVHLGAEVVDVLCPRDARGLAFVGAAPGDTALLAERRERRLALLTRPRSGQTRGEQSAYATAFYQAGFEVHAPVCAPLEASDIVTLRHAAESAGAERQPLAFFGYGARSSLRSAGVVERFLEMPVTPLPLCDSAFVHLACAVATLDDGTLLVCASALGSDALATLERLDGVRRIVIVPREEALTFGLELFEIGHHVLVTMAGPTVLAAIASAGRTAVSCPRGYAEAAMSGTPRRREHGESDHRLARHVLPTQLANNVPQPHRIAAFASRIHGRGIAHSPAPCAA